MLRPRFALLASVICACWTLAGSARPAHSQIIYPIPSRSISEDDVKHSTATDTQIAAPECALPQILAIDPLAPPIHTCALPPNFRGRADTRLANAASSLVTLQSAAERIADRLDAAAATVWSSLGDQLTVWNPSRWAEQGAADHKVTIRTASATRPAASTAPQANGLPPIDCPLACLLDWAPRDDAPQANAIASRAAAKASNNAKDDLFAPFDREPLGMLSNPASSRRLQPVRFATDEKTALDESDLAEQARNVLPRTHWKWSALQPGAAAQASARLGSHNKPAHDVATSGEGWSALTGFRALDGLGVAGSVETIEQWVEGTIDSITDTMSKDALWDDLAWAEAPVVAPGQSDPGRLGIAAQLSRVIVTPVGPVVLPRTLEAIGHEMMATLPPGEHLPALPVVRNPQALSDSLRWIASANPLQPWLTWGQAVSGQVVDVAAALRQDVQDVDAMSIASMAIRTAALNSASGLQRRAELPPLPEVSQPRIRNVSATTPVDAETTAVDEPLTDSAACLPEADELWPRDDDWWRNESAWWRDYACPCERAADELLRRQEADVQPAATRPKVSGTSVSATRNAPAQMLGNIAPLLTDRQVMDSAELGLQLNDEQDGLSKPALTQPAYTNRQAAFGATRFGLAAGYRPGTHHVEKVTSLSLQELEFVKDTSNRLGLAVNRVAQGFQEAASILIDDLSAAPATSTLAVDSIATVSPWISSPPMTVNASQTGRIQTARLLPSTTTR